MPRALKILAGLLLLLGVVGAVISLAPTTLLTPIATYYLNRSGFQLEQLAGVRLGSNRVSVQQFAVGNSDVYLSSDGIEIGFSVSELISGRLRTVDIERLEIEIRPEEASVPVAGSGLSLSTLMEQAANLPFTSLRIESASIESELGSLNIAGDVESEPTRFDLEMSSPDLAGLSLEFAGSLSAADQFDATLSASDETGEVIETRLSAQLLGEQLRLAVDADLRLDPLYDLLPPDRQPFILEAGERLAVQGEMVLESAAGILSFSSSNLTLDNGAHSIVLSQAMDGSALSLALQLPVTISAERDPLNPVVEFSFSDSRVDTRVFGSGMDVQIESTLTQPGIRCTSITECMAFADLSAAIPAIGLDSIAGTDLALRGEVLLEYNGSVYTLRAPQLSLAAAGLSAPAVDASVDMTLTNLILNWDGRVRGQFAYSSNDLSLTIDAVALQDPQVSGVVNVLEDQVAASLELSIAQSLKATAAFNHHLGEESGRAEFELLPFEFSQSNSLSSLFSQDRVELDVVSGSVEGSADIQWHRSVDGAWQASGTQTLNLRELSGFFGETFFVALNTALAAELTEDFVLRSSDDLVASIATLDIGLPVENARWRYAFDSGLGEFRLRGLSSSLLGGTVEIPDFSYSTDREENELAIVLSNLDLNSIVNLAEYPNLYVDGLISGYLPLTIRGNRVLIEEGLIGALNPGGNIRYTPSSPVPSNNSSIRLINDALSNYQYRTMDTEVFYDENGDLRMMVTLQGINPDMNGGQPINLNVSITDNIPTLLRSLQAARTITDELESRLGAGRQGRL